MAVNTVMPAFGRTRVGIYGNGGALTSGKYSAGRQCPSPAPRPRLRRNHLNHRIS